MQTLVERRNVSTSALRREPKLLPNCSDAPTPPRNSPECGAWRRPRAKRVEQRRKRHERSEHAPTINHRRQNADGPPQHAAKYGRSDNPNILGGKANERNIQSLPNTAPPLRWMQQQPRTLCVFERRRPTQCNGSAPRRRHHFDGRCDNTKTLRGEGERAQIIGNGPTRRHHFAPCLKNTL